ncbi:isoaspartyl peptidase/L-asparaginase family protein, partial [Xanthovirga aplysinae]|uniref:isoaspartyl peptidase/L-asparaginase family protein n=1 Tax=Xanthovirga aplysinae TaxID=2529853 RepID=UPI0012BD4D30
MRKLFLAVLSILISAQLNAQHIENVNPEFALVIHGGAGTIKKENMTKELEKAYREKLTEALQTGYDILKRGGSSEEAVQKTINVMENSPLFNAGKGAVLNEEGFAELDASIMNGKTLNAGAVAGVHHIKNPIDAAIKVMNVSPHVMLAGDGADQFATEQDLEMVEAEYFITNRRKKGWEKIRRKKLSGKLIDETDIEGDDKHGTVGAVALDKGGNIVAGTSTGGMTYKQYGRIGDSPIIGAGTYANNKTCGISGTGWGEYFIRNVVGHDISAMMEYKGYSLKQASEAEIKKVEKLGGDGGVIGIDHKGNISMAFNTAGMYRGYVTADG